MSHAPPVNTGACYAMCRDVMGPYGVVRVPHLSQLRLEQRDGFECVVTLAAPDAGKLSYISDVDEFNTVYKQHFTSLGELRLLLESLYSAPRWPHPPV